MSSMVAGSKEHREKKERRGEGGERGT